MTDSGLLQQFLDDSYVDAAVWELRPDYRAMILAVGGLFPSPGDEASEALLREAETVAADLLRVHPVDQVPHVASWQEACREFGA